MPVLDEHEDYWDRSFPEERRAELDSWAADRSATYGMSYTILAAEVGFSEPRTDWRYKLGQWLIRVGTRVRTL